MPQTIDREGDFRGRITEYGLRKLDSGAVCLSIHAALEEKYEEGEWQDWQQYEYTAAGDVWLVKKDGTINEPAARSLVECAGWDGEFSSLSQATFAPKPCQFTIKTDTYNGETRYRISFVNPFDRTPGGGGLGNVDTKAAASLDSQYGSQMRALFGNAKRNAAAPKSDTPPSPPMPKGPSAGQRKQAEKAKAEAGADGIPF